jgi:serpin B
VLADSAESERASERESGVVLDEHLEFSLSLHRQLAAEPTRSFCWSPHSVASCLGLTAAAAAGTTRAELTGLLGAEPDRVAAFLARAGRLEPTASDQPELAVSNALWARDDLPLNQEFLDELHRWPHGAVRHAPFRAEPERARQRINDDVRATTRDLIPELLPRGSVDAETVAALVNALYLKVAWTEAFDSSSTVDRAFHAPGGDRDVPTMRATRSMGYAERDGWQIVGLAAAGGVEAVVLLPGAPLEQAEPRLDDLGRLLPRLDQRRVALSLPRFEVTGRSELSTALTALGAGTAFTPEADFSALTPGHMRISALVHQSVLRVDESGLEGAAATASLVRLTAAVREPEPIRVDVDRPFLFLVRDQETAAVHFLARVTAPR